MQERREARQLLFEVESEKTARNLSGFSSEYGINNEGAAIHAGDTYHSRRTTRVVRAFPRAITSRGAFGRLIIGREDDGRFHLSQSIRACYVFASRALGAEAGRKHPGNKKSRQ